MVRPLFNTAILFFIPLSPHIFMLSVILTAPEPWWTHQRLESPEDPTSSGWSYAQGLSNGAGGFQDYTRGSPSCTSGRYNPYTTWNLLRGNYHFVEALAYIGRGWQGLRYTWRRR